MWNSSTIMTWGSFLVRLSSFFLLLPLILNKFSAADIVIWYLFSSITALQCYFDMGFGSTLSRAISFSAAGAKSIRGFKDVNDDCGDGKPNWDLMGKVVSSMKKIYLVLSIFSFILIGVIGTLSLIKPISAVNQTADAWLAWMCILVMSPISLWASIYTYYLEGTNQILLLRRLDIFFGVGGVVSSVILLFLGGGLLSLVLLAQFWVLARILLNVKLCHKLDNDKFKCINNQPYDKAILRDLWPSTWRSGLGGLATTGFTYGSSLIVAQLGEAKDVASYLFAMRLIDAVSQFSMAPFYSKIPLLARKRAEGNIGDLIKIARRGMILGHWTYVFGFLFLAFFATFFLQKIHSNTLFVEPDMWLLMGAAFFIHRYGAMHVQLYSTTNHIVSHIAEIGSGIIFLIVSAVLMRYAGIYALPIGLLSGYLGFYAWYNARISYKSINTSLIVFESYVFIPPLIVMLIYSCYVFRKWLALFIF